MAVYEDLLRDSHAEEPDIPINEDDLGAIMYTAGTTGLPKGAVLTQKSLMMRFIVTAVEGSATAKDKYLSVLPLFHIACQVNLGYLRMGATTVILKDFEPQSFCELVQEEKVTSTLVAPTIIKSILEYPQVDTYDLRSLEKVMYGASPIPVVTLKEAVNKFRCGFIQFMGGTEVFIAISLRPEDHVLDGSEKSLKKLGSAGRQSFLNEVKVLNERDLEVKPGEVGEIVVRSEGMLKDYWRRPDEARDCIKRGWFHTGDMATVDEVGYIYVVERKKDMIISGGENIYPREIEEVLYQHPSISEAAVIGVPDEKWGESVKALLVVKQGAKLTEEEAIQFCKVRLASYKKPRSVEFVESLPRNPLGKVVKTVLREKYWKGHKRRVH
jgi:acyl-CoA synthetase (AMP-forming)/AMP-acid ligase II